MKAATTTTVCENCGAVIGRLETPCVWQEHVVCRQCHDKLAVSEAPPARKWLNSADTHPSTGIISVDGVKVSGGVVCPYCHQPGVTKVRGLQGISEIAICLLLFMLLMIPGVIYYIAMESRPYCPNCCRRV